jgi:hypothetical protein
MNLIRRCRLAIAFTSTVVLVSTALAATATLSLSGLAAQAATCQPTFARGCMTAKTTTTTSGTIVAALGSVQRSAPLTVTKTPPLCASPALTGFTLPSLAYVGDHPVATISLSCAPRAPIQLALTSDSPDLPVPSTVTVGRSHDHALVKLAPKPAVNGQYTATVTVSYGGASLARTITIDPGLSLVQITADSAEPDAISFDVLFTGVLPAGGETVQLASSNSAVTVPATSTFPAGSVGGEVTGIVVHPVTQNTKVRLSAALGSRTLGAAYVLLPPFTSHDHITVSAENGAGDIYGQDFDLQYNVTLSNPAPDSGINVTLTAADPSLQFQTPTTSFIPPGFTTTSFLIDAANVTTPVHTQLTATADGVTSALAVTIEPGLSSFANVPAAVPGGQSFTATVNLAGPVDTATTVALQSDIGVLSVPLTVVIPAGQSSASFTATTGPVTSDTQAFITASLGTTQLTSSTVTITP